MDTETIIRVRNLTTAYGGNVVLDDLSFDVQRGQTFIILGGSGCGKSTLMKHMIGLYKPVSGQILIGDTDIVTAKGRQRKDLLRRFGVMYQGGALFGSMTVHENIRLVLEEFTDLSRDAMDVICRIRLNLVGLGDAGQKFPSELSGGMQKRAAVARAMALDPAIIFLDEPSAGLDPITAADFDQLINRLAKTLRITFVVVTHELASIYTIADHVIMLDKVTKKIIAQGMPQDLRDHSDNPWVRHFFNREPSEERKKN
ncbi:MAG: ATP-binding cassette domain-containing protein [Phycisphaerales bacterium]|nr:MAG: ATP-binding cassette domain-containing protein [Phycisphaerales bacterium]